MGVGPADTGCRGSEPPPSVHRRAEMRMCSTHPAAQHLTTGLRAACQEPWVTNAQTCSLGTGERASQPPACRSIHWPAVCTVLRSENSRQGTGIPTLQPPRSMGTVPAAPPQPGGQRAGLTLAPPHHLSPSPRPWGHPGALPSSPTAGRLFPPCPIPDVGAHRPRAAVPTGSPGPTDASLCTSLINTFTSFPFSIKSELPWF